MKEPKMSKLATHCMRGLEKVLSDLDWVGAMLGWLALNFLVTLFCLVTWPFGLYLWFKGDDDA
jgi:hypothetical protein